MKKIKKKALTLIEIMVVIALIGIIGSVVGVNMKKSMDKAKIFKAKAQAQKIEDALNIFYAENNETPDQIIAKVEEILEESGLFKDNKDLLKDPYGKKYQISFVDGGFTCQLKEHKR
jgi:general secretion pathway protein G